MLKPSPPRRVNNPVDRVTVETWNRMVTCIEWLLKHLTPDNRTIYFDGTGQLTAKQSADMTVQRSIMTEPHMFDIKLESRGTDGEVKVFAIISNPPKYIVAFNKVTSNSEAVFINTEIDVTEFIRGKSRFGIHIKLLGFADDYNGAYFEYIASLSTFDFQNNFRPSSCIAVIDEAGDIAYEYNGTGNYFYIDGQGRTESTGAMYFPLYSDDGIEYIGVDIQNSDIHPRPRTLAPEILNHYIRLEQPDGEPSIDWDVYVLLLIDEADHWRYHAEVVTVLKTDDEPEGMNIKVQYRVSPNADNTPLNFANRYLL